MPRSRAPSRRRIRALAAAVLALGAAACTDQSSPVSPEKPGPPGPPAPSVTIQALRCSASRETLTVGCVPAAPDGKAQGDIILGNQGVYVKLTSSNVAYNAGTGQFTFDVTVQNLIEQPLGTLDGTTLAAGGIRVFFFDGPNRTGGTGTVSVLPDGFATFTSAGQAYYQYNNVLAQNAVSGAKTWTIVFPPTVTTFDFLLYVNAPVEYPVGYITLNGLLPDANYGDLHPAATAPLTAVVKNHLGQAIPGTVTFATTDPNCATVDAAGVVSGVQFADCAITAASGVRTGELNFHVTGASRAWSGNVSTDWNLPGNWSLGRVPLPADSVIVPVGVPNFPVLTSAVSVQGVAVADNATLDVAAFDLTAGGNVATGQTAPSGIVASGTGRLVLAGTGKLVSGRFPRTLVSGTYSLNGTYEGSAPQVVDNGKITSENFLLRLTSQ